MKYIQFYIFRFFFIKLNPYFLFSSIFNFQCVDLFSINLKNNHLNKIIFNYINKNQNIYKKNFNIFFFTFFLNKYLSSKIKKNVFFFFNNSNINLFDSNKYLHWLLINFKKSLNFNISNIILDLNFIKTIIFCLLTKDSIFFINWLKYLMEIVYYKNHKKLLISIKYIISFIFKYLNINLKLSGIKFSVKGKISLGGNSKKKNYSFNLGKFSLNKKLIHINFSKTNINTLSGSLGLFFFIFF